MRPRWVVSAASAVALAGAWTMVRRYRRTVRQLRQDVARRDGALLLAAAHPDFARDVATLRRLGITSAADMIDKVAS